MKSETFSFSNFFCHCLHFLLSKVMSQLLSSVHLCRSWLVSQIWNVASPAKGCSQKYSWRWKCVAANVTWTFRYAIVIFNFNCFTCIRDFIGIHGELSHWRYSRVFVVDWCNSINDMDSQLLAFFDRAQPILLADGWNGWIGSGKYDFVIYTVIFPDSNPLSHHRKEENDCNLQRDGNENQFFSGIFLECRHVSHHNRSADSIRIRCIRLVRRKIHNRFVVLYSFDAVTLDTFFVYDSSHSQYSQASVRFKYEFAVHISCGVASNIWFLFGIHFLRDNSFVHWNGNVFEGAAERHETRIRCIRSTV